MKSDGARDRKKARIGVVDESTLSYYRRVAAALDEGFESDEDRGLFVRNVFNQLLKETNRVCRNQTISKIVERLLAHADAAQCSALIQAFVSCGGGGAHVPSAAAPEGGGDDGERRKRSRRDPADSPRAPADSGDWLALCKDRFASHVLQAAVARMSEYVAADDDAAAACMSRLCSAVGEACGELATDTYASHVVRVTAEVAGGAEVDESVVRSRLSRENPRKVLFPFFGHSHYKKYKKLFKTLGAKLFPADRNAIFALAKDVSANPVMQTVLAIARHKDPKLCSNLCRQLLVTGRVMERSEGSLPVALTNEISSYLFEAALAAADDELYGELFDSHIRPCVPELATHPVANFVLQRVLATVRNENQFKTLSKRLCDHFEDVLACGHAGVLVRLFEASQKYLRRQPKLVKGLLKAFHCYSPDARQAKAAHLVLQLSTYETFYGKADVDDATDDNIEKEEPSESAVTAEDGGNAPVTGILTTVTYQGSLLMQQLFRLESPGAVAPFVASILSMRPAELRVVCCSPCGSHAVDAFLDSPAVQTGQKLALWKKLQSFCVDLCCDKHGSRVMDRLWTSASRRVREELAAAAGAAVRKLMGSPYGRILCSNFAINDFLHRRREWDLAQSSGKRKDRPPPVGSSSAAAADVECQRPAKKSKRGPAKASS